MRITGGTARNRKLLTPKAGGKEQIRPTSDRVREALFSILGSQITGARVLDLFAGTGSFGLDALSRGAEGVVFVDRSPVALQLISHNLVNCFARPRAELLRHDLTRPAAFTRLADHFSSLPLFSLVFLDPPYEKKIAETALTLLAKTGLVASDGCVIVEERWRTELPGQVGKLCLRLNRRYGETGIWIYRPCSSEPETFNK